MKVLVAAGGTGGHFYPGLAVAKEILKHGDRVHFVIRQGDFVSPLLEREQIPFTTIAAAGFQRRWTFQNILLPFHVIKGFFDSLRLIRSVKPDVLMLMGGYLSVPLALAGGVLRVPVFLHEQNSRPGLANRLLSRFAKGVAISFEQSRADFKGKVFFTGNPIRSDFFIPMDVRMARSSLGLLPDKKTILVFGGSLGAHRLNFLFVEALSKMKPSLDLIQVLHLSGEKDQPRLVEAYKSLGIHHRVWAYCHDMPMAYAAADLVVARAGASTVSELLAIQRVAILIPYPYATDNHQTANAQVLVEKGVAVCHQEKNLTGDSFAEILRPYIVSDEIEVRKRKFITRAAGPSAAELIRNLLNKMTSPALN